MLTIDHVILFMGVVNYVVVYFDASSSFSFRGTASGCFLCWYVTLSHIYMFCTPSPPRLTISGVTYIHAYMIRPSGSKCLVTYYFGLKCLVTYSLHEKREQLTWAVVPVVRGVAHQQWIRLMESQQTFCLRTGCRGGMTEVNMRA